MHNKTIAAGLLAAIIFQTCVLAGEYLGAVYPLWTGQAVKLKTMPVDPRSLFRGNYARLRYEISTIPAANFKQPDQLRNGEVIYVSLKAGPDEVYSYSGVSLDQPTSGIFLRGRIANERRDRHAPSLRIKYGIEAYFAPKQKALALERKLGNALAVIMVAGNGRATLQDVITANRQ